MFSKVGSGELGVRYTAVRLLGGEDLTDEGRAFAERYGVRSFPTLLALTPDGALLEDGFPRDLEGILATLRQASARDADFRAQAKALEGVQTAAAHRTMAKLYTQRHQWEQARARLEAISSSERRLEDTVSLIAVLEHMGATQARKALLETVIRNHRGDARHIAWRIMLAEADADGAEGGRPVELAVRRRGLEALLEDVQTTPERAAVRARLADVTAAQRDREAAMAHWDWILEHAPTSDAAVDALHGKGMATIHRGYGRGDLAEVKAGRALLRRLVDEHPKHAKAEGVRRLLVQVDMIVQQLEARPDEPGGGR